MSDIIQRIKQKLAYLREHEDFDETDADLHRNIQIFSSSEHRYNLKSPASDLQIAGFEAQHKIELPEDYRRFLLEVGTGGAGPGYQLYWPFEDMVTLEEVRNSDNRLINGKKRIGDLRQPFPFVDTMDTPAIDVLLEPLLEAPNDSSFWGAMADFLMAGHLIVGYSGYKSSYSLIVSGTAHGQIWYIDGGFYTPVKIAGGKTYLPGYDENMPVPADAQRVTFTQWYNAWLDEEIAIAQNHWQKRGRTVPPLILTEGE